MNTHDVHIHFFSPRFFEFLAEQKGIDADDPVMQITDLLGWEAPESPEQLAERWIEELDGHEVSRAALISSVPEDQDSVARAVARYPERFVGFFMVDPTREGAVDVTQKAFDELGLRCACLFPAMHHYRVYDEKVLPIFEAAARAKAAVFVHCGVLKVGVRKKLDKPSDFDMRYGNPLDLHSVALTYPRLPILIPHFGAGMFREALMVADICPNIYLDTSSSNNWIKFHPGLTLEDAFSQALAVAGPNRLVFGTDSSHLPRGWQTYVHHTQVEILDHLGIGTPDQKKIFSENFDRIFRL